MKHGLLIRDVNASPKGAIVVRLAVVAMLALLAMHAIAPSAAAQQTGFVADFTFSPAAPVTGQPVSFTSTSSVGGNRVIVRESWEFDADGIFDASGNTATHTFAVAGTFRVTLEVEDNRGRVRTTSKLVPVAAPPEPPPPDPPPPNPPPPNPPPPPPSTTTPPPAPTAPTATPFTSTAPAVASPTAPSAAPPPPAPAGATLMSPFPIVRVSGNFSGSGVRLRLVAVTAPVGSTITLRCTGRGCPYRQRGPFIVRQAGTRVAGASRYVRIGGFAGRLLRPGAHLRFFVTQPRRIGKYTRFTIRRGRPPLRVDNCLRAGGSVVRCD